MSFCTWLSEFFGGNKVTPIGSAVELKPEPEIFCRSNRRDIWVKRILSDMIAIGADLIVISTPGNEDRYRGIRNLATLGVWDTHTMLEVELATLWSNGEARGSYQSTNGIDDTRPHRDYDRLMKRDYEVVHGFRNEVTYYSGMYSSRARHFALSFGLNLQYLKMVAEFNADKLCRIAVLVDGTSLYRTIEDLLLQAQNPQVTFSYDYVTQDGDLRRIPNWVMYCMKDAKIVDADENVVALDDPISIIKLEDGEDVGNEAYIHLIGGALSTYTRGRYRIEVESERLFANKIVDVDALLSSIARRLSLMGIPNDGKLFIDNIRYKCLDGTTHTADVGGFLRIGAEAFRAGRKYAGELYSHLPQTHVGPFIVSHATYPTEPLY